MADQPLDLPTVLGLLHQRSIPIQFDAIRARVPDLLERFRQADPAYRAELRARITPEHGSRLVWFARDAAVQAVRPHSSAPIILGLLAVALEGVKFDFRDTVTTLCLLYHSAMKIGVDPVPLFQEAASYAGERAAKFILDYLATGDKRIEAIGMKEEDGSEGFDYVSDAV